MNKAEFIRAISKKAGKTQEETRKFMDAVQEAAFENLKDGEVKLIDGVTLYTVYKEAHEARNPQTGEMIQVEAKYVPRVKLGKAVKDAVQ